jgi:hypothetical protein
LSIYIFSRSTLPNKENEQAKQGEGLVLLVRTLFLIADEDSDAMEVIETLHFLSQDLDLHLGSGCGDMTIGCGPLRPAAICGDCGDCGTYIIIQKKS